MAFILGVLPRISDTSIPISMKLRGRIEFTLKLCIVIFLTSVSNLKPEVSCFSWTGSSNHRNRKSKSISSESSWVFVMRVLYSFFDFSILVVIRFIFVRVCPYTLTLRAKIFKSLWRLPWSKYQKMKIVLKQQNFTPFSSSSTLTSGSDVFNFRFQKNSPLPVWGRNRKSKSWRCKSWGWNTYTLKVSFKSTV